MQEDPITIDIQNATRPGFWRVFASLFYDLWLVLAIWLLGVIADTVIRHTLTGSGYAGNHLLLQIYLVISPLFFYVWFWTHGGQTLGMRAWRIRVLTTAGQALNWQQAGIRYLASLLSISAFGLGYLWIFVDKNNASWHDKLSNTCLVMIKKRP